MLGQLSSTKKARRLLLRTKFGSERAWDEWLVRESRETVGESLTAPSPWSPQKQLAREALWVRLGQAQPQATRGNHVNPRTMSSSRLANSSSMRMGACPAEVDLSKHVSGKPAPRVRSLAESCVLRSTELNVSGLGS